MSSSVTVSEHLHTEVHTIVNLYPQAGMLQNPQWMPESTQLLNRTYTVFSHAYILKMKFNL